MDIIPFVLDDFLFFCSIWTCANPNVFLDVYMLPAVAICFTYSISKIAVGTLMEQN